MVFESSLCTVIESPKERPIYLESKSWSAIILIENHKMENISKKKQRNKGVFKRRELVLGRVMNLKLEVEGIKQEDALEHVLRSC